MTSTFVFFCIAWIITCKLVVARRDFIIGDAATQTLTVMDGIADGEDAQEPSSSLHHWSISSQLFDVVPVTVVAVALYIHAEQSR
jgi:hypothetical protein